MSTDDRGPTPTGRPEMTAEQRAMAVALLANALRKDAHLRERARLLRDDRDPLRTAAASRRSEPSQRYLDGMCDLLRVLFADGAAGVESCLEEATALAMGAAPPPADSLRTFH